MAADLERRSPSECGAARPEELFIHSYTSDLKEASVLFAKASEAWAMEAKLVALPALSCALASPDKRIKHIAATP